MFVDPYDPRLERERDKSRSYNDGGNLFAGAAASIGCLGFVLYLVYAASIFTVVIWAALWVLGVVDAPWEN